MRCPRTEQCGFYAGGGCAVASLFHPDRNENRLSGISLAVYLLIAPLRGAGIGAMNLTGTGIASVVSFILYFS